MLRAQRCSVTQNIEHFAYLQNLCIGGHGSVVASDIEVALEELTEAPTRCLRLIAPVHARNVVALDRLHVVERQVASKWDREIKAQTQHFPACTPAEC